MNEVVIVSGMRTPVGDFLGSLKDLNLVDIGVMALKLSAARRIWQAPEPIRAGR
jgi:acetyl-CoA C-acetyltransferase